MALQELIPWRWGGLREWRTEEQPLNPFRQQMEALHRNMDRVFDELMNENARQLAPFWGADRMMPKIDETEDDKAFHVSVELPGMDEKDVDIRLSGRMLTIRGEKQNDEKEEGKDYYRRERSYGSFRRTLELPGEVDESKIEAKFKKGVLRIELPKTKEAQAQVKHIQIKAA